MWCEEAPRGGGSRSGQGHRLTHKVSEGLRTGAVYKQAGVGGHRTTSAQQRAPAQTHLAYPAVPSG